MVLRYLIFATCAIGAFGGEDAYYNDLVDSLPPLQGKCVAITGTTSGLGFWAAVATAKKGASCLLMLNRESERSAYAEQQVKSKAAAGVEVITVGCDLQNMSSVRAAAIKVIHIAKQYGGLDVLALNAGIMSQPDLRTPDGFDVMMQANHLSHFLLTKLLLPSLDAAAAEGREVRIVTHSSIARAGGGAINRDYYVKSPAGTLGGDDAAGKGERYHQSKLANILFAMALHAKLMQNQKNYNFKALSAAPGVSQTSLDFNLPVELKRLPLAGTFTLSAADGSCSLLTAMFAPSANSGDFYEPQFLFNGPTVKVISEGVPLSPVQPLRILPRQLQPGTRDAEVCDRMTLAKLWSFSEAGLGEIFSFELTRAKAAASAGTNAMVSETAADASIGVEAAVGTAAAANVAMLASKVGGVEPIGFGRRGFLPSEFRRPQGRPVQAMPHSLATISPPRMSQRLLRRLLLPMPSSTLPRESRLVNMATVVDTTRSSWPLPFDFVGSQAGRVAALFCLINGISAAFVVFEFRRRASAREPLLLVHLPITS